LAPTGVNPIVLSIATFLFLMTELHVWNYSNVESLITTFPV